MVLMTSDQWLTDPFTSYYTSSSEMRSLLEVSISASNIESVMTAEALANLLILHAGQLR